jgi:hypothetical protein
MAITQLNGEPADGVQASEPRPEAPRPGQIRHRLLGDLLIHEGLISDAQLEAALRAQAARGDGTPLGQLLVEQGALSASALDEVLARYHKQYRLGDLLVETNVITEIQLQLAIDHHRRTGLRLGDALLQLGFVSEEALKHALCTQFGIGFVDLDRLVLGPGLAVAVPKEYAQRHRVVPVASTEDALTVALADPTDWWLGEELQASLGCRVHLVASTDAAFQRAFARVYGEEPAVGLAQQQARLAEAHAALSRELDAAVRALGDLRQAQEGFLREQADALRAAAEQSLRQEVQARVLAELRAAHAVLREEHEARARAYAELSRAQAETLASLTTLREEHARLLGEHQATARALAEERERRAELARTLTELEAAHVVARREIDERLATLTALDAAYAEATRSLVELRAAHAALLDEHARVVRDLTGRAESAESRQRLAVDHLETLLARLRA